MLKFIYLDIMDVSIVLAPNLLYAARKYLLLHLVDKVTTYMATHLKSQGDKAGSLLMLQNLMQCGEMESDTFETCLQVIENHAASLLESDEFSQLKEDTVNIIIQRDKLFISEETLYRCLLKWSVQECERRDLDESVESHRIVLDKLIHHIRFTTFNLQQLSKLMDECRILSNEVIADLLVGCSNPEVKKSIIFFENKEPRIMQRICGNCRHSYNSPRNKCDYCNCYCMNYISMVIQ